jgi:hypothetical protein
MERKMSDRRENEKQIQSIVQKETKESQVRRSTFFFLTIVSTSADCAIKMQKFIHNSKVNLML